MKGISLLFRNVFKSDQQALGLVLESISLLRVRNVVVRRLQLIVD